MEIIEISEKLDLIPAAIEYFWKCWGNKDNYIFYKDCMMNSLKKENAIPKFYVVLEDGEIIASYAIITNDLISRQDLMPWLACLFVNEDKRGKGIAEKLLNHGLEQTKLKGYDALYLSTDLVNFYERKGWEHICDGYGFSGGDIKIYSKET